MKYLSGEGVTKLWSLIKANFVTKQDGKDLSSNDFTNTYKTKLDGIATGANKTVVDSSLSTSSTNPVQNKVIANKFGSYYNKDEVDQLVVDTQAIFYGDSVPVN